MMTNREWLFTLSDERLAKYFRFSIADCTDWAGWLQSEHKSDKDNSAITATPSRHSRVEQYAYEMLDILKNYVEHCCSGCTVYEGVCKKCFVQKVKRVIGAIESDDQKYICSECGRIFTDKEDVYFDVNYKNDEVENILCSDCWDKIHHVVGYLQIK